MRLRRIPPQATTTTIAATVVVLVVSGCGSSSGSRPAAPTGPATAATSGASTGSSGASTGSPPVTPAPAATITPPSALAPIAGTYAPAVDPANFVVGVNNPYWPLPPGTTFHFRGVRGRTPQTDDAFVTRQTKQILGITCTVVRDTVSENGHPIERTFDWYAQDRQGNVWYMGEDSLELKNGHFVRASDSWEAGVNGAEPGIIMPASPQPGDQYRQEYYPPGDALDQAHVLSYGTAITVPYGTFKRPLITSEFSPLEPQTEEKTYVAGLGEVAEAVVKGHHEQFQLVSVTR